MKGKMVTTVWITLCVVVFFGGCAKRLSPPDTQFESPVPTFESPLSSPSIECIYTIDGPLVAGATLVSGTGPPGVPLYVIDVTLVGEKLGMGVIGDDGRFVIEVDSPLVAGHQVGLTLGPVEGTGLNAEELLQGKYDDLPLIGVVFTKILVQERLPASNP